MACSVDLSQQIIAAAQAEGVDPGIALAVARMESGICQWTTSGAVVTSSAGAIGVMQLEPSTAAALGVDPYDVNGNIQGGILYLKQLYQQYGSWDLALAAYNWGPGRLSAALASTGNIPGEVANYVKGILGMGTVYNAGISQIASQSSPQDSYDSDDSDVDTDSSIDSAASGSDVNLAAVGALGALVLLAWWIA
jgi:soluble lytic murein transglycosylase-like protein